MSGQRQQTDETSQWIQAIVFTDTFFPHASSGWATSATNALGHRQSGIDTYDN
jgi:hypothetical protein